MLVRISRELGSDFDLLAWDHRAVWNPVASRVEMQLVSVFEQTVLLPAQRLEVTFRAGEAIWTESSHKYWEESVRTLIAEAGFRSGGMWVSQQHGFLEALCLV